MPLMWSKHVAQKLGVNLATVKELAKHLEGAVWSPLDDGNFWVRADAIEHWRRHLRRESPPRTVVRTHPGGPETTDWPHA
jgi:hypothetical protein